MLETLNDVGVEIVQLQFETDLSEIFLHFQQYCHNIFVTSYKLS